MDISPFVQEQTPEDSGLGESSQNESKPSTLFTPIIPTISSRKRKIFDYDPKHTMKQGIESVDSSPWPVGSDIFSSTLNDSITTGVEKCNLDSFAANFYTERSERDINMDTTSFMRKIKEPSTPSKCSMKRYHNTKSSTRLSPMIKLGSPERNGILYSSLQPTASRYSDSKRYSPVKKCLFTTARKDPVAFFCKERNIYQVMLRIFLSLPDEDLYTCSKVSKIWKKSIMSDENLKKKLQLFVQNKIMNKENDSPFLNVSTTPFNQNHLKQSTPIEEPPIMYEITNSLTEGQHLEKCISCNKPIAVVDKNISQCTNYSCGVIRCLKCNSISKTGPENFVDSCHGSMLLIEKPSPKYSLFGSPKRPTIFMDDSHNTSQSMNSSGYATDMDISRPHRHSLSFNRRKSDISQVLKACNSDNTSHSEKNKREWRKSIFPVVSVTRKTEEIIEPSSPPKVQYTACTKKNKKSLKRLIW